MGGWRSLCGIVAVPAVDAGGGRYGRRLHEVPAGSCFVPAGEFERVLAAHVRLMSEA